MPHTGPRPALLPYFKHPFPKAEGFSAYRMPGLFVHVPVILIFGSLGAWLCRGDPWLYPLFLVYAVAGVTLGRDLVILAHYNGLVTLGVLAAAFFLVGFHEDWPRPGAATSVLATLALASLLAWCAKGRIPPSLPATTQADRRGCARCASWAATSRRPTHTAGPSCTTSPATRGERRRFRRSCPSCLRPA